MIYSKLVFWWDYVIIGNRVLIQVHCKITTMGPLLIYYLFFGFLILVLILNDNNINQKKIILLQGRLLHVGQNYAWNLTNYYTQGYNYMFLWKSL
jgi:hypothetical protein